MTTKLQNVILVSTDVAAAERFYVEGLGLKINFRDANKWTQMKAGDSKIAIASPAEGPPSAQGATPVFEVDQLDACVDRLASMGAAVLVKRDMGSHGRTATVRDPDGNLLQIFERAQK